MVYEQGEVLDAKDSNRQGRLKIKVFGRFDELENDYIPWFEPGEILTSSNETGGGFLNLPKVGSIVNVYFPENDIYNGVWFHHNKISEPLKEKLDSEEAYEDFNILYYDVLSNFYIYRLGNEGEGFYIRLGSDDEESDQIVIWNNSRIEVKNADGKTFALDSEEDFIKLEHDNGSVFTIDAEMCQISHNNNSTMTFMDDGTIRVTHKDGKVLDIKSNQISLGKEDESSEQAVLGNTADDVLQQMIDDLGTISGIPTPAGPSGSLSSAPNWQPVSQKIKQSFQQFLSRQTSLD